MAPEQALVIYDTVRGSLSATMTFGEIVARLAEIGVERYHADYARRESTFYLGSGDSIAVAIPWAADPIAAEFSASAVETAVRQSQRGEHTFLEFVQKTMAAGCVGYFVQISGRRVQYFGRRGEIHTEWFPGAQDK